MKFNATFWVAVAVFQLAYGAAVFSVTRAYYLDTKPASTPAPVARTAAPPTQRSLQSLERFLEPQVEPDVAQITDPQQLANLADDYFAKQDYARAADIYARLITMAPGDAELYNNLGITLHYLGRTDEALEKLKHGTTLDPSLQRIWLTLGFVQGSAGHIEEARSALQRAIDLDPASSIGQEAKRIQGNLP